MKCEWLIQVKNGFTVNIKFTDFQVDIPYDDGGVSRNDYVLIFDANDESTSRYFHRSDMMYFDGIDLSFQSKSNRVVIQFISDGQINFRGFNATYKAVDLKNYCDKNQLLTDSINFDETRCLDKGEDNFFKRCFVKCFPGYTMKSSSLVVCRAGNFTPQNPCHLIDWEVHLCEITNMNYCLYSLDELADHWLTNGGLNVFSPDADSVDSSISLDLFPDPDDSSISARSPVNVGIQAGRGSLRRGVEAKCFDKIIGYSYCTRRKNRLYAFPCKAFMKIKKLPKKVATRKTDLCFKCRKVGCSAASVYI